MVRKKKWRAGSDKPPVFLYTLTKEAMQVDITNYGATLVSIRVPDGNGQIRDVLLGYDCLEDYERGGCFFGALVGRCANRIGGGEVTINGTTFPLEQNDGDNTLHSASHCLAYETWEVDEECSDENHLYMTLVEEERENSFPGKVYYAACYELLGDGRLRISVKGVSDKDTIINLTSHGYFHLDGHDSEDCLEQELEVFSEEFTPLGKIGNRPNGEVHSVEGTSFDFRKKRLLLEAMNPEEEQIVIAGGYDHNYLLRENAADEEGLIHAATAYGVQSGIYMKVLTNCPCIQLYSGNYIENQNGKKHVNYHKRSGLCIEPQYTPDAIHLVGQKKPLVKKGETYEFKLELQFGRK